MAFKNNVIDMTARRRAQVAENSTTKVASSQGGVVQNLTEMRQEFIDSERRKNKRTILSNFMGTYVVVPDIGLQPVALYDISDTGAAFDTTFDAGKFRPGEEYAVRIYLSRDTYFPFIMQIKNVRELPSEGVYRHGALFVTSASGNDALKSFIQFIESISAVLRKDPGDRQISNFRG
jgi:hypothetical protein